MMRMRCTATLLAALLATTACRSAKSATAGEADSAEVGRRESHLVAAMAQPDSGAARGAPLARWIMRSDLKEISGLALTGDGRLFTHGDKRGVVSEIDFRHGVVLKRFTLGLKAVHADFEGIAVAGDVMFLLASNGKLYEFQEGADGAAVEYIVHDTRLGHECEFEGIAFDPKLNALLLACKHVRTDGPLQDSLVIYRWQLPSAIDARPARLTVPLTQAIGANKWKGLHPSDITVDPTSGNYVLVAAEEKALIEITPAGAVVSSRPLPTSLEHTEGVAITPDSILILGDEAGKKPASISLYRWR
jgi:uncharacterized protein YjiK